LKIENVACLHKTRYGMRLVLRRHRYSWRGATA